MRRSWASGAWALPTCIFLTTLWSVMAIGGSLPIPCLVAGVLAAGSALVATRFRETRHTASASPAIILAALAVFSLLQTVPLPLGWTEKLSPSGADIWARALRPLSEAVTVAPVSLDPGATTLEAVKFASYAAIFYASAVLARDRGAPLGIFIVFVCGTALAVVTAAHEFIGAKTVFGLYEPRNPFGRLSPLLNANNLAGYLNLGTFCGLGLLQLKKPLIPRPLVGAGMAAMLTISIRTASRGGLIALIIGMLTAGVLTLLLKRSRPSDKTNLYSLSALGAALTFAVGVAVVTADTSFTNDLLNQSLSKLRLARLASPVIEDFAAAGLGRGAFESVFMAYRPEHGHHVAFTHPENLAVQWVTEWGLLIGGSALLALLWAFRPRNMGTRRSALAAGVFGGIVALFAQNFVDLGLDLAGPAIAFLVAAGSLWGDVARRRPTKNARFALRASVGWASVGLIVLAALLYVARPFRSLAEDRELAATLLERRADAGAKDQFKSELRGAMLRHPADYYFPLLGGIAAATSGEPSLPWLQRALERGPTVGRTHLALAEVLYRNGATRQALLELRLAVQYEPSLVAVAGAAAVRMTSSFDDLAQAVPEGAAGALTFDAMARALGQERAGLREQLDEAAIARVPGMRGPTERLAAALILALSDGSPRCLARQPCIDALTQHGESLARHHARSSLGAQFVAKAHSLAGREDMARDLLRSGCKLPEDDLGCLQALATIEVDEELSSILDQYTSRACSSRSACGDAWTFAARVLGDRKLWAQAHTAARRAAQQDPTAERWILAADFAEQAHLYGPAIEALRAAKSLRGQDPQLDQRLTDLRGKRPP